MFVIRFLLFLFIFLPLTAIIPAARMVTVNEIKYSLSTTQSFNVGFDIDDTVFFSSPGFYHYVNYFCNGELSTCLERDDFWEAINNGADNYSLPKKIAVELINMHQERGDDIYFITARKGTKSETVTPLLQKAFNIKKMNQVLFAHGDKTESIKENNIKIYYGDADADMECAKNADARPIRILRAKNSYSTSAFNLGKFDEEILVNSDI